MEYIYYYFALMSVIGFIMMGVDKSRARKHRWRISEAALLFVAFIGGAAGVGLGMLVHHHKTKHIKFLLGVPALLLLNAAALWYLVTL